MSTHAVPPDRRSSPHISIETPDSTVESYANNVIDFLASNLKNERVERQRLASEAEAQITRLCAQLASREAEMQALLVVKKQKAEFLIQVHKLGSTNHASVDLVLESQNRSLEIEIEELKSQVSLVVFSRDSALTFSAQLRAQTVKLRSPSASVTQRAGRQVSPSLEQVGVIPSAVHR
jgi:hypothetical protein